MQSSTLWIISIVTTTVNRATEVCMGYSRSGGGNKDYSDYWKGKFGAHTHTHNKHSSHWSICVERDSSDSSLDSLYSFLISAAYYFKCETTPDRFIPIVSTALLSTQCAADGLFARIPADYQRNHLTTSCSHLRLAVMQIQFDVKQKSKS